jgi:hypothetical protein
MNSASNMRWTDGQGAAVYAAEAIAEAPRLLALLDREPQSASFGSFDREHWGWKFRDFPLTMLQAAMHPLALLWRHPFPDNPYHREPQLLRWIEAAIRNTCARQHRDGAFDSVAPQTQSYGATLAIVHCLTETVRILESDLSEESAGRIKGTVERACRFALRGGEDYAFISNHHALFAVAWLNASELLGEPKYRQRAEQTIEEILRRQSPDGWYREYDGPDPGYESLGIFHLAAYWQRTGSPRLLESLERSLEFYSHCVQPDGSIGGVYGSRQTALYFPCGFEILAAAIPRSAAVAAFMRERITWRNVLTPAVSDPENLVPLTSTYLESCLVGQANSTQKPLPELPCEELYGRRRFPDAGIVVVGTDRYYAVISTAKGGVCRIFDRRAHRIAYEDGGYVVRAAGRKWTSQHLGPGRQIEGAGEKQVVCETVFSEVLQELATPAKFLLLRLGNLTLFRSRAVGEWLQRLIVHRLIRKAKPGPLRLRRSVTFEPDQVSFCDQIELTRPARVEQATLPRSFLAVHMGSAKYFHPSELISTPEVPAEGMVAELNKRGVARCEFTLRFSGEAGPKLSLGSAVRERETAAAEACERR